MNQVQVSVIIPVYNAMPFLEENIKSLLMQTLKDIEIIYIDDKSTDGSLDIIKMYKTKNEKIIVVENHKNVGVGISRNIGYEIAHGEYIAHLDADDYFDPRMLELMYKRAVSLDADVIVCDYFEENVLTNKIYERRIPRWFAKRWEKDLLLERVDNCRYAINVIPHPTWNKLIKKSFLEKNKLKVQEIRSAADVFFGNAVIIASERVAYMGIDSPCLMHYRMNTGKQITSDSNPYVMNVYCAEKALHDFVESSRKYRCYRVSIFLHLYQSVSFYFDRLNEESKIKMFYHIKNNYAQDFQFNTWKEMDSCFNRLYKEFKKFFDGEFSRENLLDYQMNVYNDVCFNDIVKYKCVLWGFGKRGRVFYRKCKQKKYKLYGIIDKNPDLNGFDDESIVVESLNDFERESFDAVIVSPYQYMNEIVGEIRGMGVDFPIIDIYSAGVLGIPSTESVYT